MIQLPYIDPLDRDYCFPDPASALLEPNGLLAFGGDLSTGRLLSAYQQGIFPWFSEGEPILWWSPAPRLVLFPERFKVSRSLRKTLRKGIFDTTFDTAFGQVIHACAEPRADGHGTWITTEMIDAYCELHRLGHAHSVECYHQGSLVGGLYGIAIGRVFFGESMFSRMSDASKVAFHFLAQQLAARGFRLIDCQVESQHLSSLGAESIPRSRFLDFLQAWCPQTPEMTSWEAHHTPQPQQEAQP